MQQSQQSSPFDDIFLSFLTSLKKARPWIVCLSASLFFFYDFMLMNMFNSINSNISNTFNLSATEISWLSGLYPMATVLFLMVSGLLLDRYSTRKIILTAMMLCILSTAGFAISENVLQAGVFRFLAGATAAFCFLSCVMLASRWFKEKNLAFVTGLIVTMAMTGGSVSQAPLKSLVELYDWRQAMFILATIGLVLWSVMYFLIHDSPSQKNIERTENHANMSVAASLKVALSNTQNWVLGLYTSLMNILVCVFGGLWGQAYVATVYKLDGLSASTITMMIFLGTTVGSPLAGWLSDYMGLRRLPMILGAMASLLLTFVLMTLETPSYQLLNALFFMLGVTSSTQVISYPVIYECNDAKVTGVCESFSATIIMSGVALFPLLYGYLLDFNQHTVYTLFDHKLAFTILPLAFTLSVILAFMVKETYCKYQTSP